MRFLSKDRSALEKGSEWQYCKQRDRTAIREFLSSLQRGYCAYSERRLKSLDAADIEHFDPNLKATAEDTIRNWHLVLHLINNRKARKIENFLPLPDPNDPALWDRIKYEDGLFLPVDDEDLEIENLIRWIGANREEVQDERTKHVARIRDVLEYNGLEWLQSHLSSHPEDWSFPTALSVELGIPFPTLPEPLSSQSRSLGAQQEASVER